MAKLRLAPAARADLVEIRIFSNDQFGKDVADAYFRGFGAAFARLRDHPLIGALEEDLGANVRCLGHRSHNIFYRIDDDVVIISRILHKARDARRLLN
jgi:toxin ParE1/3/4